VSESRELNVQCAKLSTFKSNNTPQRLYIFALRGRISPYLHLIIQINQFRILLVLNYTIDSVTHP